MRRTDCSPRRDWQAHVESLGLVWHSVGDKPYWDESACYRFTLAEIETIEKASAELYEMFLAAGQHVLDRDLLGDFGIPAFCHEAIVSAHPHGRFTHAG